MAFIHVIHDSGYMFKHRYKGVPFNFVMKDFKDKTLTIHEMCARLNSGNMCSELSWFVPVDIENEIIGDL